MLFWILLALLALFLGLGYYVMNLAVKGGAIQKKPLPRSWINRPTGRSRKRLSHRSTGSPRMRTKNFTS